MTLKAPMNTTPKRLSARAYARHRGCDHKAVTQAIEIGRLHKSVKRGQDGEYAIDPKRADIEWAASTYSDRVPLTGPTAPARRRPLPPADVARMVRRLTDLMAELQADSSEAAASHLPLVLEGAADWLRAAGRKPTAAEVASALGLDTGLDGPPSRITSALLAAVDDPDMAPAAICSVARRLGQEEAARWCEPHAGEEAGDGDA